MTETGFQLARAITFVSALGLVFALERASTHARIASSWRANGALWIVGVVLTASLCGACACTAARWAGSAGIGLFNQWGAGPWIALPATIVALDLVSYAWHRANHRIPVLWRFHRVHHSDPTFTVTTALRFHPGELLASLPLRLTAILVLGPSVEAVFTFEALFMIANLLEHGNVDLPASLERRLSLAVITPALHRRHHSQERSELDSNFGTVFTLWDRSFGTFGQSSSRDRYETGLVGFAPPSTLTRLLGMPFGAPRPDAR